MDMIQEAEILVQLAAMSQEVQRLEREAEYADKFYMDALAVLGHIIVTLMKPMPTSIQERVELLIGEITAAIIRTSTKLPRSNQ